MSFSSPRFVIFFIVIYVILWINRGFSSILKGINQEIVSQRIILLASYLFLYLIDYRFCFCLFFITCLTYFTAVKIDQNRKEHKYYKKYLVISTDFDTNDLEDFKTFMHINAKVKNIKLVTFSNEIITTVIKEIVENKKENITSRRKTWNFH